MFVLNNVIRVQVLSEVSSRKTRIRVQRVQSLGHQNPIKVSASIARDRLQNRYVRQTAYKSLINLCLNLNNMRGLRRSQKYNTRKQPKPSSESDSTLKENFNVIINDNDLYRNGNYFENSLHKYSNPVFIEHSVLHSPSNYKSNVSNDGNKRREGKYALFIDFILISCFHTEDLVSH